jgi:hypothetical protein
MSQMPEPLAWHVPPLPPVREFILSPGFAGAAAMLAAVIVSYAVLYGSRRAAKRTTEASEQRERHHQETRKDEQHASAVRRCWDRLVWVVETAGIEPAASQGATLGLGPELAMELLRGLLRDAEQLEDDTLAQAVTVYQNQLALVLAQQGGPLTELGGDVSGSPAAKPHKAPSKAPAPPAHQKPPTAPSAVPGETSTQTAEVAAPGRRRRS